MREHFIKLLEDTIFEDLSVKSSYSIDMMRTNDRHIGHADFFIFPSFDHAKNLQSTSISRISTFNFFKE
jgi:hypothetical protein